MVIDGFSSLSDLMKNEGELIVMALSLDHTSVCVNLEIVVAYFGEEEFKQLVCVSCKFPIKVAARNHCIFCSVYKTMPMYSVQIFLSVWNYTRDFLSTWCCIAS